MEGGCGSEVVHGWVGFHSAISIFGDSLTPSSFLQKFMGYLGLGGRVMNPAAEGEAARRQRNQHDWGVAGDRGMAEMAKEELHIISTCPD
jgi:hypothetical protein